jgi:hypothetical protein
VRNESPVAATFGLVVNKVPWESGPEFQGGVWEVPSGGPVAPGSEAEVVIPLGNAMATPDTTYPAIQYPADFYIRVNDAQSEIPYSFFLSGLTVRYPEPSGVAGATLEAPERIRAGTYASFTVHATARDSGVGAAIELYNDDRVLWHISLNEEEAAALRATGRAEVARDVPMHLLPRSATAGLTAGGYRIGGTEIATTITNHRTTAFPRAELRPHGGVPTVFMNGKPFPWSGYASYEFQPGNVAEFGASGANVFVIPVAAGNHVHTIVDPTWTGWDTWDFGDLDERVAMALQANPEAYLELRLNLSLPPFWIERHPEARAMVRTTEGDFAWEETNTPAISIASEAWQAEQETAIRKVLEYCATQRWAERVFAVVISGEVTEEWFMWGCNDGFYADYSPVAQAAFAAWCKERGLPWTEAPDPAVRNREGWDWYPGDDEGRHAAAYAQFLSDLTADVIARFARTIKDATDHRMLTGALHGYVMQLAGEPRQHLSGHFAMDRLLDCPDFDFFMGIPLHNFRNLRNGYDTHTSATRSIQAAGKVHVNENDLFSWLHQGLWHTPYNEDDPRAGAISMHRRVFTTDFVLGSPRQWFSLFSTWHHDAELQAEFAQQIQWQRDFIEIDRTPSEEIAFVVDDASFAWMPPGSTLHGQTHPALLFSLSQTGAAVGVWLMRDLDKLPDRTKLVVIAGAAAARQEHLAALRDLIETGGRTLVVVGPVGLVDRATWKWDTDATAELTGLPIRIDEEGGTGSFIGPVPHVRPRAVVDGPGWAEYTDGLTAGAERPLQNNGRLIWCGVPPSDIALLRKWAEEAGVHCIAPVGNTVHSAGSMVSVTAGEGGYLHLQWPGKITARDLYSSYLSTGTGMMGFPFEPGQTRLLLLDTTGSAD